MRIYRPVSWFLYKASTRKLVNLTISGGIGPMHSTKSQKAKKVRWWTGLIWRRDTPSRSLGKLWIYRPVSLFPPKSSCCKFVNLTISGGIDPIQSQNETAKKRSWFTTVLFDVEIHPQDHGVKLWIYRPFSLLLGSQSSHKSVNSTISGGIELVLFKVKTKSEKMLMVNWKIQREREN